MTPDSLTLDILIGGLARAGLAVLALATAWIVMVALDFLLLPFLPGGPWKRPWCWLMGHIDGEDFEVTERGVVDICTRCGRHAPGDDD